MPQGIHLLRTRGRCAGVTATAVTTAATVHQVVITRCKCTNWARVAACTATLPLGRVIRCFIILIVLITQSHRH
jgi:hypothetical protein